MTDQPFTQAEIAELKPTIPKWQIIQDNGVKKLQRDFAFEDFAQALKFTNRVGSIAEEADHHPEIFTEWGGVTVTWWTHAVDGLQRNDFEMAAKTDEQYKNRTPDHHDPG